MMKLPFSSVRAASVVLVATMIAGLTIKGASGSSSLVFAPG